jgi:hypothetical protein
MRCNMKTTVIVILMTGVAWAQQDEKPDVGKMRVERKVLERLADAGKSEAELPIKEKLAAIAPGRVSTGKVAWRESLEAALEQAKASGKPVLVFQLLGKLDDEWC